ncbi:hypothetical protein HMPREF9005_0366, partial [Actinomyces sp. oral taxon 178 str. F0338]
KLDVRAHRARVAKPPRGRARRTQGLGGSAGNPTPSAICTRALVVCATLSTNP